MLCDVAPSKSFDIDYSVGIAGVNLAPTKGRDRLKITIV